MPPKNKRKTAMPAPAPTPESAPPMPPAEGARAFAPETWLPAETLATRGSLRTALLCAAVAVLAMLPFVNKAFHVDDPLFIWTAKHLLQDPLRFYGFELIWNETTEPMWAVNQNPPLLAYYLVPFGALFGFGENAMHLAMLPFAALAGAGAYLLAARFTTRPIFASALALLAPGLFVNAAQVMSDIPMTALWLWALLFWLWALDRNSHALAAASVALIVVAMLIKYFAAALVPLLAVYTLLHGRRAWPLLRLLAAPIVVLIAYEWYTLQLYGTGLLADAGRFARSFDRSMHTSALGKYATVVTFTGGALASIVMLAPWLWTRRVLAGLGLAVIALTVWSMTVMPFSMIGPREMTWPIGIARLDILTNHALAPAGIARHAQWALWFVAGAALLTLPLRDFWRTRSRESLLLLLWVGGTVFFVAFLNHIVNGRVIAPMALPMAALAMRQLAQTTAPEPSAWWRGPRVVLVPAALFALTLGYADYRLANSQRAAAHAIVDEFARDGRDVWFSGGFGWQYYWTLLGARVVDLEGEKPAPGDHWVLPTNSGWVSIPPFEQLGQREHRYFPIFPLATTSGHYRHAGFHGDMMGPLPFTFGWIPSEEYNIVEIVAP